MADNNTIARPYAQAAFDLAQEAGELDAWSKALAVASAVLADGRVGKLLAAPSLKDAQRLEFLTGLIGAADGGDSVLGGKHPQGTNFLKLLLEYDRVKVLPEIAAHFEVLKARVENTVDVTITSATALGAEQRKAIATALRARLGREVRVESRLDEKLIGGAVIRAGDVVIDGSLRARLTGLANALIA